MSQYLAEEIKKFHSRVIPLVEYPFDMSFIIVFLTAILALVFVLFSHFLSMRRIEKWNLADISRQKE